MIWFIIFFLSIFLYFWKHNETLCKITHFKYKKKWFFHIFYFLLNLFWSRLVVIWYACHSEPGLSPVHVVIKYKEKYMAKRGPDFYKCQVSWFYLIYRKCCMKLAWKKKFKIRDQWLLLSLIILTAQNIIIIIDLWL